MKSKNKLVPRLLGITKESVMRVDEKTKDVVQEWPLTTVKRWAASPKSFTLVLKQHKHPQPHRLAYHLQMDQIASGAAEIIAVVLKLCLSMCRISGSIRRAIIPFRPLRASRYLNL